MRLEEPGGAQREVSISAGEAYFRNEGVEHNVINIEDSPMSFVEVELKRRLDIRSLTNAGLQIASVRPDKSR